MSGLAPAPTDATAGIQFDDVGATAAAIAQGSPPSRIEFDALVEQMEALMTITKDMQCRVVELIDNSCKAFVSNPGSNTGAMLDALLANHEGVKPPQAIAAAVAPTSSNCTPAVASVGAGAGPDIVAVNNGL
jgi:hypothetical protein